MCVCMCVCVCMYICESVHMRACVYIRDLISFPGSMHARMGASANKRKLACMHSLAHMRPSIILAMFCLGASSGFSHIAPVYS